MGSSGPQGPLIGAGHDAKSIGLSPLARLAGAPLKYGDLKKAVRDGTQFRDGTHP